MRTITVCRRTSRPGFTLVELVTVMTILAVLVTLTVGAVQGIRESSARKATEQAFAAIDTALQAYFDDWGKYPWYGDRPSDIMVGWVAASYRPAGASAASVPYPREAALYAALNMKQRHGPYMQGGAAVVSVKYQNAVYPVYADGWGRPILYRLMVSGTAPTGQPINLPQLISLGSEEFDSDPPAGDFFTPGDAAKANDDMLLR